MSNGPTEFKIVSTFAIFMQLITYLTKKIAIRRRAHKSKNTYEGPSSRSPPPYRWSKTSTVSKQMIANSSLSIIEVVDLKSVSNLFKNITCSL